MKKESLSGLELKNIFLKKTSYWPDSKKIRPVHQTTNSEARKIFVEQILNSNETRLAEYWIQQKQNRGLIKPIQVENNRAVIQFVANIEGAIGYILISDNEVQEYLKNQIENLKTQKLL